MRANRLQIWCLRRALTRKTRGGLRRGATGEMDKSMITARERQKTGMLMQRGWHIRTGGRNHRDSPFRRLNVGIRSSTKLYWASAGYAFYSCRWNEESWGQHAPASGAGSEGARGRQPPALVQKTGHGKTRLGTAASCMSWPSTAPSSATPTRPRTAESSLRNQRIDSIRALHLRPPTREASPSWSVRFIDEGVPVSASRSGSVGNLTALFGVASGGNRTGTSEGWGCGIGVESGWDACWDWGI